MIVYLDSIIFGIQRFGGISNYWKEIILGLDSNEFNKKIILPKGSARSSIKDLDLLDDKISFDTLPKNISRYMPFSVQEKGITHTSYYRRPSNKKGPYIVTAYDFTYEKYISGWGKLIHSFQKSQSLKYADHIICISNSTKNDLLEYNENIDENKVSVIHLGINQKNFFAENNSINKNKDQILFVGHRSGYKRFDLAVRAMEGFKELSLGVVGDNLNKKELELLDQYIPGRWVEHGYLTEAQLRSAYNDSLAFIFPSEYEGFGLPILEAMSCGCPVISSSQSSLPEIAGEASLKASEQTVDSYIDAIQTIVDSPSLRRKLINEGLDRAKIYTWQSMVEKTQDVYRMFI